MRLRHIERVRRLQIGADTDDLKWLGVDIEDLSHRAIFTWPQALRQRLVYNSHGRRSGSILFREPAPPEQRYLQGGEKLAAHALLPHLEARAVVARFGRETHLRVAAASPVPYQSFSPLHVG